MERIGENKGGNGFEAEKDETMVIDYTTKTQPMSLRLPVPVPARM